MHSCGEGLNLVRLSILAMEGLSTLTDLWAEAQGDKDWKSMNGDSEYFLIGNMESLGVGKCCMVDWWHGISRTTSK